MTRSEHGMDIEFRGASVHFGSFQAVHPTDLKIEAGEFFSILGPSGCGKTTLLRLLSGFLDPSEGEVLIGGKRMMGIGPSQRPTSLIFQNLALFPLMTVWENVAFALEMRGWSKSRRRERAMELLATVALAEQADKTPAQLSGGQKQRVAIARALAVEPAVLLLDEPLSALDLKLRQHMRAELKEIQERTGITFVYITHDQGEALTMSDRIAVMNSGQIVQVGSADDIYGQPTNAFVATFVGETNMLRGTISDRSAGMATLETALGPLKGMNPHDLAHGSEAMLFVRPERMRLLYGDTPENRMSALLARRDMEGAYSNLILSVGDQQLTVHLTNQGGIPTLPEGPIPVGFSAADGMILPVGEIADE